ncbi:unnamed protein product [Danaus chrysippus]|uniref:(African queen) hypothetical protein n=1 Tax=Danaus chrysippus TaxID=151541 RepID=A0A8J2RE17_9NEOP|nr:unnamed protein product [Danaus chrysippus]
MQRILMPIFEYARMIPTKSVKETQSAVMSGEGPFRAARWCLSKHIIQEIAILCVSMSQSRRIYAGPFVTVDLPTFVMIVRGTYSVYTVLRQTSE